MKHSKINDFRNFGGGVQRYTERRQALGKGLSPRLPKGGQRHRGEILGLIDTVGGDSYGK